MYSVADKKRIMFLSPGCGLNNELDSVTSLLLVQPDAFNTGVKVRVTYLIKQNKPSIFVFCFLICKDLKLVRLLAF